MSGNTSILLSMVIFSLTFFCLRNKRNALGIYLSFHCGLVEQWYLSHIYCCHQHKKWCCWFVHVLHVFRLAGKLEMIGQVTHSLSSLNWKAQIVVITLTRNTTKLNRSMSKFKISEKYYSFMPAFTNCKWTVIYLQKQLKSISSLP